MSMSNMLVSRGATSSSNSGNTFQNLKLLQNQLFHHKISANYLQNQKITILHKNTCLFYLLEIGFVVTKKIILNT